MKKHLKLVTYILSAITLLLISYLIFLAYFYQKIYPGVKVANFSASGQNPQALQKQINDNFQNRLNEPLKFTYQDQIITLLLTDSSPELDIEQKVKEAYSLGRTENVFTDLKEQFLALTSGANFTPSLTYKKEELLKAEIAQIGQAINKDPVNAQLVSTSPVTITSSAEGIQIDEKELFQQIDNYLSLNGPKPTSLPIKTVRPQFTTENAEKYRKLLENIKASPIKLHYNNSTWIIDQSTLISLLNFNNTKPSLVTTTIGNQQVVIGEISVGTTTIADNQPLIDKEKLTLYLQKLSTNIDQPASDAKFIVDTSAGGIKVREFQPAKEGKGLDIDLTATLINQAVVSENQREIGLPVKNVLPKVTTADTNSFGINKLLGEGVSHFEGSIENRIFNIGLAASRINGTLIPPGETFSFVKTVGDISGASGYKPAYVIKSGRTVLDDGGGVCQVSTTLFRAILNSGLPITERTAHAYRVGYYEQGFPPGLDATIFSPSVDLKFKNDTSSYLLIQANTVGTNLYIDIYGADDGRTVSLTTPKISSQTPPPAELRQDDPTLPRGTIKQVDWSAWGANVSFSRTVSKDGQVIINETFKSNYRPWQAVYLVGTKD